MVAPDGEADEPVADQPSDEDDGVGADEEPFGRSREDVGEDQVDVLVIRDAVVVRALNRRRAAVAGRRLGWHSHVECVTLHDADLRWRTLADFNCPLKYYLFVRNCKSVFP